MSDSNDKDKRQTYKKPELLLIALTLSQSVLAACKTRGGVRSWGHKCDNLQGKCINRKQGS